MTIFKKNSQERLVDIGFNIHKFSTRPKPEDPAGVMIISMFSEFGCEVLSPLYIIPRLKAENPDLYVIVMGWYGREYLYRHLADEFWETKEEVQWLRDSALAFHHNNKNLQRIEKAVGKLGKLVTADALGRIAVGNKCHKCYDFWGQIEDVQACPKCSSKEITKALFADVKNWKKKVHAFPKPSEEKMRQAAEYLRGSARPVGVIARNRITYGRNLQAEFYVKLLEKLVDMGYDPIWLGEKQSTLACPVENIIDMTRKPEAKDLELTLAIVSQLQFTVQYWTASTRLASLMNVPFLVFESPDQVFGAGQEGYRLSLCTTGKAKIVLSHFLNVYNDHEQAISLTAQCIEEMEQNNWNIKVGMVDEPEVVKGMMENNKHRLIL